jgi:NADH:ubiquinone oxidoreductase subunit 6 (subunit J)
MEFKTILFYLFSTITVLAALRVITARNPVHAVLFLVLAFFNVAASGCCCRPSSSPWRWSWCMSAR